MNKFVDKPKVARLRTPARAYAMRHSMGMTHEQIAKIEGLKPSYVRALIWRRKHYETDRSLDAPGDNSVTPEEFARDMGDPSFGIVWVIGSDGFTMTNAERMARRRKAKT